MSALFVIAHGHGKDVRFFTSTCRWAKAGHPKIRHFATADDAEQSGASMPLVPVGGWRVLRVVADPVTAMRAAVALLDSVAFVAKEGDTHEVLYQLRAAIAQAKATGAAS